MPNILAHDPIRDLPIYLDGFAAGQDVGVRIALEGSPLNAAAKSGWPPTG